MGPTPPSTTVTAGQSLDEQFRSVMRLVPHPVVVCTSVSTTEINYDGEGHNRAATLLRGMTMSSFTSVSLDPTPVVALNIATPSLTMEAITSSQKLNIHILRGDAEGARVAEWFRRGNADDLGLFDKNSLREGCGCELSSSAVVPALKSSRGKPQPPLLIGNGVLYVLRCRLLAQTSRQPIKIRDHVIVLAELVDIVEIGVEEAAREGQGRFGLAYADRRYRQLGGTIVKEEEEAKVGKSTPQTSREGIARTAAQSSPKSRQRPNIRARRPARNVPGLQPAGRGAGTTSEAASPAQPATAPLLDRVLKMVRGR